MDLDELLGCDVSFSQHGGQLGRGKPQPLSSAGALTVIGPLFARRWDIDSGLVEEWHKGDNPRRHLEDHEMENRKAV